MKLSHIHEVHETGDPDEVNRMLRGGDWQLLGAFQRATQADGIQAAWALYVLGRGEASRDLHEIESVKEMYPEEADKALKNGAVLLRVFIRKGEYDELPRFIIGWPRETA